MSPQQLRRNAPVSSIVMKRVYKDGQYTVERRADWLLQITIEGPFGERAAEGLRSWLDAFPAFSQTPLYILLEASHIGPVKPALFDGLIALVQSTKIAGMAVVKSNLSAGNLDQFAAKFELEARIEVFDTSAMAFQWAENLHTLAVGIAVPSSAIPL